MTCRTAVLFSVVLAGVPARAAGPQTIPDGPTTAAVPGPTATPDPARSNTLRWSTKGGSTNYGYEVFRAESEAGPFTKVNGAFISGHLAYRGQQVQRFTFTDTSIDPSKDYWYYVESVNLMNERARLTPIQKAPAKLKPSAKP
jgi:hypothetical protein